MTTHRLGRDFAGLPLEEQIRALRDHARGQELLIGVLMTAVERLGVEFIWPDTDGPPEGDAASVPLRPRREGA